MQSGTQKSSQIQGVGGGKCKVELVSGQRTEQGRRWLAERSVAGKCQCLGKFVSVNDEGSRA